MSENKAVQSDKEEWIDAQPAEPEEHDKPEYRSHVVEGPIALVSLSAQKPQDRDNA